MNFLTWLNDDVVIGDPLGGWTGKTKGVHIPVGQTKTIEVDLFSDAPTPPWNVRVYDLAYIQGGAEALDMSLDTDHGQNGDKLALTITPLLAGAEGGSRFLLVSDDGVHGSFWIGYVGN